MTPAPGKSQSLKSQGLKLLRRTVVQSEFKPTANQSAVIDSVLNSTDSRLIVYGPAGSGKSATLVESVVRKIANGFNSNSILVLAYGRERASQLRDEIVIQSGASAFEPLVRTFHSLAFSIINTQLDLDSPKYVLISGAEQDSFIRDLLAHPENSPGVNWPAELSAALGTRGFARELRDLMLRASERNFSYKKLIEKAQLLNEPWWIPAAKFWESYDNILGLRYGIVPGTPLRIDPSSIISLAINQLRTDAKLLAEWQNRFKLILVDEFQESDSAQRELLELLSGPQVCIFADPNSTVGQFRGAEPEGISTFVRNNKYKSAYLDQALRGTPSINDLTRAITEKLPNRTGIGLVKEIEFIGKDRGVDVAKLANQVDCANYIAHAFRTAHLQGGLAWSQMAVILRSPGAAVASLTRAFALNNIPVEIDADALSLGENPAVTPILTIAEIALGRVALTPANWEAIEELLLSEFGGADALSLRQMRIDIAKVRSDDGATRSSTEIILSILNENDAPLPWEQIKSLKQIADLIAAARLEIKRGGDISDLIWAIWSSAKSYDGATMANSWRTRAIAGGVRGAAADRDLDAVIQLFESARRFAERMPGAGPQLFIDQIRGESILSDAITAQGQRTEVVRVMTVHSTKGLEWELVALTGLQEGIWPNLRARGSLLGSERLVESERSGMESLVARSEIEASAASALIEDERRLLGVALSRAKSGLIVTAFSKDDDSEPSQYFEEIYEHIYGNSSEDASVKDLPRSLTPQALVATLRRNLMTGTPDEKEFAAGLLKTLANEGITSADPGSWLGASELSSFEPSLPILEKVSVSPSNLQSFSECGLKWFIEKSGGRDGDSTAQLLGIAIHALAAMLKENPDMQVKEMEDRLASNWALIDGNKGWVRDYQFTRAVEKLRKFYEWQKKNPNSLFAVEAKFHKEIGRAIFNGSVDRVEIDAQGRVYIVDLKSGASDVTKDAAQEHKQLAGYQLAIYEESFTEIKPGGESGGAELVFLGNDSKSASVKKQGPLDHQTIKAQVIEAADAMSAAQFSATVNKHCRTCSVSLICPIQPQGRSVIEP